MPKLELTVVMKRQLETLNKISLEKRSDSFPRELKPNLLGSGFDLNKLFRFLGHFFVKRR